MSDNTSIITRLLSTGKVVGTKSNLRQVGTLSTFRLREFKRVAKVMPLEVLEYIEKRGTKIKMLSKREIGSGHVGYANAIGNYMAVMVMKDKFDYNYLHYSTLLHEFVHIAQPDLYLQDIWEGLEREVLDVGKRIYDTAKKIISIPNTYRAIQVDHAKKVVDKVLTLLSADNRYVGTTLACHMRSIFFHQILTVAKEAGIKLSYDCNDGYNARWIGQCLVAYTEKHLSSKKLTEWKNIEEAICEKLSHDLTQTENVFKSLMTKLYPPIVEVEAEDNEDDPIEEMLRAFGFYTQSAKKTQKKAKAELTEIVKRLLDKDMFVHLAKKGTMIQVKSGAKVLAEGRGFIGLLKDVWRSEL